MDSVNVGEMKAKLSEYLDRARYERKRVVVNKGRKPVAVILNYEDYQALECLEDIVLSRMALEAVKKGKFLSLEEAAKRLKVGV